MLSCKLLDKAQCMLTPPRIVTQCVSKATQSTRLEKADMGASLRKHSIRSDQLYSRGSVGTFAATVEAVKTSKQGADFEVDRNGSTRLAYRPDGWNYWDWNGKKVHYIQAGDSGPPVVLVHGFGASGYHWRYNIPALAASHRVYAVDLLGFGWSEKALVSYEGYSVWGDQLGAFLKDVVGEPAVLVGNSLGGYNSLQAAARFPDLVSGVVLLNGAGRIEDVQKAVEAAAEEGLTPAQKSSLQGAVDGMMSKAGEMARRAVIYFSFYATKQPSRVMQVLKQVYVSDKNVDDELVKSITRAAEDPNAPEVFYRVITGSGRSVNSLLSSLKAPLFLLWGSKDPWIGPAATDKIMRIYPEAQRTLLNSGHCPHDDTPDEVNAELLQWLKGLPA